MRAYRRWRARRMMRWAVRLWRDEVCSPDTTLTRQWVVLGAIHGRRQVRRARRLIVEMTSMMAALGQAFAAMAPAMSRAADAIEAFCAAYEAAKVHRANGLAANSGGSPTSARLVVRAAERVGSEAGGEKEGQVEVKG